MSVSDLGSLNNPTVSAHLHQILLPIIDEVLSEAITIQSDNDKSKEYTKACQDLKSAFSRTERHSPGFAESFVRGVLPENNNQINELEACIRLAGLPCPEYRIDRSRPEFLKLEERSMLLKRLLCQIPDDIKESQQDFLMKIKAIAQAIQSFLSAIDQVLRYYQRERDVRKALDKHKMRMIQLSKNFSDKVKLYLQNSRKKTVFNSVESLILQINTILVCVSVAQYERH